MGGDIKILTFTNPKVLELKIKEFFEHGYDLKGSVSFGVNDNGRCVYIATLTKQGDKQ